MDPDGAHVFIRVEQTGDTFDFPLTVTVQYANGQSETVVLAVTSATHEMRIPAKGVVRQVDTRDDLGLVTVRR
jgi:hypothetical protein